MSIKKQAVKSVLPCTLIVKRGSRTKRIPIDLGERFQDVDLKIRETFKYDTWDHCSAFFEGKPWRSATVAEVYPDGSGAGQKQTLAKSGLGPGMKMSYVYDFGDDIQHEVTISL